MKIFLDTADTAVIEKHFSSGLIDGITTNPTLIMKSGRNPEDVYQELIDLGIPDISMEVVGTREQMLWEGRRLANKFGKEATIKVPCTPDGLYVCRQLAKSLVKVNVTLIFDEAQATLAATWVRATLRAMFRVQLHVCPGCIATHVQLCSATHLLSAHYLPSPPNQ